MFCRRKLQATLRYLRTGNYIQQYVITNKSLVRPQIHDRTGTTSILGKLKAVVVGKIHRVKLYSMDLGSLVAGHLVSAFLWKKFLIGRV